MTRPDLRNEFDPDVMPGLSATGYVFERMHRLLAADAGAPDGANIGATGSNLTISFLSLDRAELSLRLMRSIATLMPHFKGTVLAIDQGSEEREIEKIERFAAETELDVRVVRLGHNYGIAGGRNQTMAHCDTDWVMFLDNDIFFVEDPLRSIQDDIATLGCHFLNMPLLDSDGRKTFARGGHLYVSLIDSGVHIGGGSAYPARSDVPPPGSPFLSTFLFGGASVVNRHTFAAIGGFDAGMFIGFEDIDFSIRLFRGGMKVGNCRRIALVHDHQTPTNNRDRDYEKRRFSNRIIERSARHLEAKYGFRVWGDAVTQWLAATHRRLGIEAEPELAGAETSAPAQPDPPPVAAEPRAKPKIALIVDVSDWAYGNIARQLMRHLSDRFEFRFLPMDLLDNVGRALILAEDCQLLHFFWRETLQLLHTDWVSSYFEQAGVTYSDFLSRFFYAKAISTAVYDHLFLSPDELKKRAPMFSSIDGYYVSSAKLRRTYYDLEGYPAPLAVLPDGVDRELFVPRNLARFQNARDREIVVGWTGNSAWSADVEDFKGVHTILKPAIEQLIAEGLPLRMQFADRQDRHIPHEKMVDYYESIDLYVCASKIEGTPNPVLESMACGVPVISTDVGIVPEVFGEEQREFLLAERSVPCMADAIRRLVTSPEKLPRLSSENLESIAGWDWSVRARDFIPYFEQCLARRDRRVHGAAGVAEQGT